MIFFRALLFLLFTAAVTQCALAADDCNKAFPDHIAEVQCIALENKKLDGQLNQAYQAALEARPKQDQWDTRKNQEQLRKSQRAWLKFREENCALVGGLEGGGNISVTQFIASCDSEETKSRIKFLMRVAKDEFGSLKAVYLADCAYS